VKCRLERHGSAAQTESKTARRKRWGRRDAVMVEDMAED
jgi:hypothetical protein